MITFKTFITESLVVPTHLPLTMSNPRLANHSTFMLNLAQTLAKLESALEGKPIYKTEFEECRRVMNKAYQEVFDLEYVQLYFSLMKKLPHEDKNKPEYDDENDIYYSDKSINGSATILKRYAKKADKSIYIAKAVQVANEFAIFKEIFTHLKPKVTSGRVPSGIVKAVNPNRVDGTCGWCFKTQALAPNGTMVHHGFARPGYGYQTPSCPGISFRNLEVSTEGLQAKIRALKNQLSNEEEELIRLGKLTSVTLKNRKGIVSVVSKGDADWTKTIDTFKHQTQSNIRAMTHDLTYAEKALVKWTK